MSKNDPAFPVVETNPSWDEDIDFLYGRTFSQGGLTKREYFAAMAMQGLCANSVRREGIGLSDLVEDSRLIADALLAELERTDD